MEFKIGQKAVIAVKEPNAAGHEFNGRVVTVLSGLVYRSDWNKPSYRIDFHPAGYASDYCAFDALEPLIEKPEFERFMERVLKPINEPIAA